ncbi:hypothetical protein AALP_AA6G262800 [Arabis alpina]|uniref:Uncharacterized protein n=1 Tax=Arabis alpina TaxID=50452 RepID=A0A087GRT5_ARAAL|nr:hypothetical protein AALP_AA6G262800 [Arabis alpina]
MGEIAVLHPRDCFDDIFSRTNNIASPHRPKKPLPNRRRRSPPRPQTATSPPPLASVSNTVRILKGGEDLTVEKPDLKPTRQIRPNPATPISIPGRKSMPAMFYAGPVTSTSPPASDVPLPAFFAKKSVSVFREEKRLRFQNRRCNQRSDQNTAPRSCII